MGTTPSTERAGADPNFEGERRHAATDQPEEPAFVSDTERLPVPKTIIIETKQKANITQEKKKQSELDKNGLREVSDETNGSEKRQSSNTASSESSNNKKARRDSQEEKTAASGENADDSSERSQVLPCGRCDLCKKPDCGHCEWCLHNARTTSLFKADCFLKMCRGLLDVEKVEPIKGIPGWKFLFADPDVLPWPPVHPDLAGLCVVAPDGRCYPSLEEEWPEDYARAFYEKQLGMKLRCKVNHELIGKGFCEQWIDVNGENKMLFGTISHCEHCYFRKNTRFFTVNYDEGSLMLVTKVPGSQGSIIQVRKDLSERMAWGGCILYDLEVNRPNGRSLSITRANPPFNIKWVVPQKRILEETNFEDPSLPGRLMLMIRGFVLAFEAKPSTIPNAGLGLFVRCRPVHQLPHTAKDFVLEEGELLDLGVYGPLRKDMDHKPAHVMLLKSLIHSNKCEEWSFSALHDKEKIAFDITDDVTGELHSLASSNVICYANETDGQEFPTIRACHDPEGSVHYLMGYSEKGQGPFSLPANGDAVELKVDYGPSYEKVRVRKGYPRVSAKEQEELRAEISKDDEEILEDIGQWSANEVNDGVSFLEGVFATDGVALLMSEQVKKRCLVAVLKLLDRLRAIEAEFSSTNLDDLTSFCDNGFTSMEGLETVKRAKNLLPTICSSLSDNEELLREAFLQDELLKATLADVLKLDDPGKVESLSAAALRGRIMSL